MLANPENKQPSYGLLCSGESFIFLKLQLEPTPAYQLSNHLNILNDGDLGTVVKVLRKVGEMTL
ncbi:MAG: hypothetical protein AAGI69_27925 [Cyanobacteria bacterium P01_H01_bin.21]